MKVITPPQVNTKQREFHRKGHLTNHTDTGAAIDDATWFKKWLCLPPKSKQISRYLSATQPGGGVYKPYYRDSMIIYFNKFNYIFTLRDSKIIKPHRFSTCYEAPHNEDVGGSGGKAPPS
jgi:hypothetical protein